MATARTLEKLDDLIQNGDEFTPIELKYIFKYWGDAPKKLQASVVRCIKDMPKIAPAIQTAFIEADARAVKLIAELLCPAAQDLILSSSDFADDIPFMLKKAPLFLHITEGVWKKLAGQAKRGELTKALLKKLCARKDCPPQFAKIAGMSPEVEQKRAAITRTSRPRAAEAEVERSAPKRRKVVEEDLDDGDDDGDFEPEAPRKVQRPMRPVAPVAKAVKTSLLKKKVVRRIDDDDEDFTDTRKVGNVARKVRRPV